jgi:putative transposase
MAILSIPQRWHAHHHTEGTGPVYQGRFKSLPIWNDEHFLTVCRYLERSPLRAKLVESAEAWRWCSMAKRVSGVPPGWLLAVDKWPVDVPSDWLAWVNRVETARELEALRLCVKRSRPYGQERWQQRTARRLGLESTFRPRGQPRVRPNKDSRPL